MSPVIKLNELVRVKTLQHHPFFSTKVDKYLKWLPLGSIFILDAFKVDTNNDLKKQVLITGASVALLNAVVQPLKKVTHEIRPNWSVNVNSFPSSHTATSFLGSRNPTPGTKRSISGSFLYRLWCICRNWCAPYFKK